MNEKSYPGINMERTGRWIRFICRIRNIAVKDLCEMLRMGSPQSIYGWFGGRTLPSLDNFYALSQILEFPLDELIVSGDDIIPDSYRKKTEPWNVRLLCYRMKFTF